MVKDHINQLTKMHSEFKRMEVKNVDYEGYFN